MASRVHDVMILMGSVDLFNQGGLAFLRDAWIAAKFAEKRQAELVRLVAEPWPDFEIRKNGENELFEAVEADDPKRKRGDEIRKSEGQTTHDPVEDWIVRAEQIPLWLKSACQKKADKRYGERVNLIIYLNPGEYGIRQEEIESCFVSATRDAKEDFLCVWILWKARAYLVWENGQPSPSFSQR